MKYIKNETISHFKKFMSKIYKKDEESILNKKKKREEVKQKNKLEKTKINKNGNEMNQYSNYMGLYFNQIQPMNNQGQGYIDDCQNIYYYHPQYSTQYSMMGYNPYFQQYFYEQPKSLEENINMIYQRGIVNNIIGAFYIKECQEKKKNKEKRKVPVATVDFEEEEQDDNKNDNNNDKENDAYKKDELNENEKNEKENDDKDIKLDNNEQNKVTQHRNELIKPNLIN